MRISDWSSDVCSSDLHQQFGAGVFGRSAWHCAGRGLDKVQGALRSLWVSHARRRPQLSCLVRTVHANARGPGFGRGARYSGRLLGKWSEQAPSRLICHCQLGCRGFANAKCLKTRSEEHTSELQSLMRIPYAVFCLKKKTNT